MNRKFTRREFLMGMGAATAAGIGSITLPNNSLADHRSWGLPPLEHMLQPDVYKKLVKDLGWDVVYGPDGAMANGFYGGRADFNGHRRQNRPGSTDYFAYNGVPLVPVCESVIELHRHKGGGNGGTCIILFPIGHKDVWCEYAHLSSKVLIPSEAETDALPRMNKLVTGKDVVARVGATGNAYKVGPHLHITIAYYKKGNYYSDRGQRIIEAHDFEKWNKKGIVEANDGKPFFWDGRTRLCMDDKLQILLLEHYIRKGMKESIDKWERNPAYDEIAGTLLEYRNSIGDKVPGTEILKSPSLAKMRSYLAKECLIDKKHLPESPVYEANLAVHSYAREPDNPIMVCLPFLAPGLAGKARIPSWQGGLKQAENDPNTWEYNGKSVPASSVWDYIRQEAGFTEPAVEMKR